MRATSFNVLSTIFFVLVYLNGVANGSFHPKRERMHFGHLNQPRQWAQWCTDDLQCGYGYCHAYSCQCYRGYITWYYMDICSYEQRSKSTAFLVSFFVGYLGVDWFVLSRGNAGYVVVGVVKMFLLFAACFTWFLSAKNRSEKSRNRRFLPLVAAIVLTSVSVIWWLTDWIRVLADVFYDGYGAPLQPWEYNYYDRRPPPNRY